MSGKPARRFTLHETLKRCVRQLQRGQRKYTVDRGLALKITSLSSTDASNYEFVLPHNRLLIPHWKAFCDTLTNFSGDYLTTFFIGFVSVQLDRRVLEVLSPALTAQKLSSLYFLANDLGSDELVMIADVIEKIPTLESLSICRNRIGDQEEAVVRLSTAIKNHPNLQRLTLASCGIGNNKVMLSCIRNKTLKIIDLGSNGIASEGARYIGKFLAVAKNRIVKRVSLVDNQFNDKDCLLFASALRLNKSLLSLDLRENDITCKGMSMMRKALFDDSSLNAISDSNHACLVNLRDGKVIDGASPEMVHAINNPDIPKYYGRKSKLCAKIFSSAADGLSNLRYFADVPVELVPEVFELLLQYKPDCFDRRHTHTMIFELLCSMPSIFLARTQCYAAITRKRKYSH